MEVKVSATFFIPGRKTYSEKQCEENPKLLQDEHITIYDGKKKKNITYHYKIKTQEPALQRINLSQESYTYLTTTKPSFIPNKEWNNLSKKKRLEKQLVVISENFNGVLKEFEIFE